MKKDKCQFSTNEISRISLTTFEKNGWIISNFWISESIFFYYISMFVADI